MAFLCSDNTGRGVKGEQFIIKINIKNMKSDIMHVAV